MLTPLTRPSTAVDACADLLRRHVLAGRFGAVGQRLPAERRLAEELGVGRVTVRSALGRLAVEGLVEARQGSGYTLRDWRVTGGPGVVEGLLALARPGPGHTASEALDAPVAMPALVADLLLVRRHLALAVLERVGEAAPACPEDALAWLSPLHDAIARFTAEAESLPERPPLGTPLRALAALDLEVVRALLALSDSPVLGLFLNPVARVLEAVPELHHALYGAPSTNVAGFAALAGALEALCGAPATSRPAALRRARALVEATLRAREPAVLARLGAALALP